MASSGNAKARVRAYIAAKPPKARAALRKMRAAIVAVAPRAEDAFSYGIPAFRLDGKTLVWYAAFTSHCSLFPMTSPIRRRLGRDLKGYATSKGTVRLPLTRPMPITLIKKLVKARVVEVRRRK